MYSDDRKPDAYDFMCYNNLMENFPENCEINENMLIVGKTSINIKHQTAIILFSSGTTGMAKGIELTHLNVLATLTKLM